MLGSGHYPGPAMASGLCEHVESSCGRLWAEPGNAVALRRSNASCRALRSASDDERMPPCLSPGLRSAYQGASCLVILRGVQATPTSCCPGLFAVFSAEEASGARYLNLHCYCQLSVKRAALPGEFWLLVWPPMGFSALAWVYSRVELSQKWRNMAVHPLKGNS